MSLLDTLDNLRSSPPKKRKMVLAVLVTIGMAFAIGLWVLQLKYTPSGYGTGPIPAKPAALLWETIRDTIKGIYERK